MSDPKDNDQIDDEDLDDVAGGRSISGTKPKIGDIGGIASPGTLGTDSGDAPSARCGIAYQCSDDE